MDLRADYMGMTLRSPLVASASPLTGDLDSLRRMQDAGVGAVVLPSLFEEQLTHDAPELDALWLQTTEHRGEASSRLPESQDLDYGPREHLRLIEQAKRILTVPVIASLNGVTPGGWVRHARDMEAAGADAIELNMYTVAADPRVTAAELEARDLDLVTVVRATVTVPLAVKLSPYYTSMANFAVRAATVGADGLVLFNRFYQPDLDLDTLDVVPRLVLSTSEELRLPLRWIAILYGRVQASLAATTGVHTGLDAAKVLLAGADVAMMTSALLRNGTGHLRRVEQDLAVLLAEGGYESIAELRGSMSHRAMSDPSGFERANYLRTLKSWSGRRTMAQRSTPWQDGA